MKSMDYRPICVAEDYYYDKDNDDNYHDEDEDNENNGFQANMRG